MKSHKAKKIIGMFPVVSGKHVMRGAFFFLFFFLIFFFNF